MKVSIIIGEICSGKTTYSSSFSEKDRVDVGSIVRQLTSTEERIFDQNLDIGIANRLFQIISKRFYRGGEDLVIAGMRQISILENVEVVCKDLGVEVEIIYLEVPTEIRKQRYAERQAAKDVSIVFELADKKDKELGLYALIQYIKHRESTTIIQNY